MKKTTRDTAFQAILVLTAVVLVNVVASGWFFRLDLTKDKVNTLSPATEELLHQLKDRLLVRVYFNSDLPSPYSANRIALTDMLQELRSMSGGKLEYDVIDPVNDAEVEKGTSEGIPQVQVQVVNNDKLEVKRAMMGLVMEYQARKQVIPVIESLANFEYEVASRVERLVNPNKKTIAIAQGNGEPSFGEIQQVDRALSGRYNLIPVDFSSPVPDSVSALLVIQPTTAFADSQLYNLDQYMMDRGRAAFFTSMVNASMQSQFATDLSMNLSPLFRSYGFDVKKDLVRDAVCASVSVMQREAGFTMQTEIPNPYIPIIGNLDKSFVVTQNLHQVILPFVSEIDTSYSKALHLSVRSFAVSSTRSGIQKGVYNLDPTVQFTNSMFDEHSLLLGAAITGPIRSVLPDTGRFAILSPNRRGSGSERIVVIGSGDFVQDAFMSNPENLSIVLNTVDYLTDDIGLVAIRSKTFLPPPLEPVSEAVRITTKDLIIALPPLMVLAIGLLYWRRTVRRRNVYRDSLVHEGERTDEQDD